MHFLAVKNALKINNTNFVAFLQQKNAHVNVAVYCGCLLVLLACSAWFYRVIYKFLFSLFGRVVCLFFFLFFFAHFDNSNFNRGLLQNSRPSFLPVEGSVLFFPCAFSFA